MEIRFKGSLNKQEFLDVALLANRPIKNGSFTFDLWLFLVIVGAVLIAVSVGAFINGNAVLASVGMLAGLALLVFGYRLGQVIPQSWDTNEAIRAEREGLITEKQVEIHSKHGEIRVPWDDFIGYGEYKGVIYLAFTGEGFFFPASFFASKADWEAFRELVQSKLSVSHEVKPFSWRWFLPAGPFKQGYILMAIIIAIAVILQFLLQQRK
jgi:hypothetical protein